MVRAGPAAPGGRGRRDVAGAEATDAEDTMKVGFIGLGIMGASMASNVRQGGHELVVHDIRRTAAAPHLEAGATWAETPRRVAEAADVVFTSLPGPAEVEAVALGDGGLLQGMSPGKAYFDLTTNSPALVRRLHAVFAERGVQVLDAPVSGGPRGARTRKLALWVGGDEQVFLRHKPVLDAIGDRAIYVGPIGAGSVAKLVHNCAGYVIQCALAEVFTLGAKAGVEPLALWQAVRQGAAGRQRTFDRLADHFLRGRYDPPDFALRLAHKDVTLAAALGREHQVPMRLAHLALDELTEALNRGWGERDSRVAMVLQQERAGVEVRVDETRLREALERDPPLL
jgi:3-hydroxyisobutyrate dehydrogenase